MATLAGRYEEVGAALAGGMGSVQPCMDSILDRKVAIKRISATAHRRRILDELAALLKMRSKHVVQVYDILTFENGDLGIVQEFIEGHDLFATVARPASAAEYYKRLWQIAAGISDIHALDVIHRDIKPNNMKTDPEGVIKIFDFGLARDDGPGASTVGFVGSRGFAAPELYAGAIRFTPAVDTYAFGATALFLGTGSLPANLMDMPPSPDPAGHFSSVPLGLAPEVLAALDACLAPDPAARPAMSEVRDLLARHVLHDRHQALVVFEGRESRLSATTRTVDLNLPTVGQIRVRYDGLDFLVESVSGEVLINNSAVAAGQAIPGSCVVSLGGPLRRTNERKFITFDISHPEIVL